ncbi:hypothetical protein DFH29DRAFT_1081317 [Suillus ampliporus]|nr:hypothetical protein DFH29DRAFT_1081317 [Suillus ampliporus]
MLDVDRRDTIGFSEVPSIILLIPVCQTSVVLWTLSIHQGAYIAPHLTAQDWQSAFRHFNKPAPDRARAKPNTIKASNVAGAYVPAPCLW